MLPSPANLNLTFASPESQQSLATRPRPDRAEGATFKVGLWNSTSDTKELVPSGGADSHSFQTYPAVLFEKIKSLSTSWRSGQSSLILSSSPLPGEEPQLVHRAVLADFGGYTCCG